MTRRPMTRRKPRPVKLVEEPDPEAYDAPGSETIMPTATNVVSKVFEAYKVNPILIGMILLLLTILGAFGYYAMRNDDRIYAYIALRDIREKDLYDRLIEMARQCRDKLVDNGAAYPEPNFPNHVTGGKAFKDKGPTNGR